MMNSIPIDLLLEIFSRLPAKSIAKCLRVSKQWESILCRPDFTELFLTRYSTRPRLLFAIRGARKGEWRFFSSPQPHNPYEKSQSSLVVTADSHIKFPTKISLPFNGYAFGLICFGGVQISKDVRDIGNVICNPSTGQYAFSPKLNTNRSQQSFLGFDPIDEIFKVLSVAYSHSDKITDHRILTFGTGKMSWRKIQCLLPHYPHSDGIYPHSDGICIDGVLYYLAQRYDKTTSVIVCFDVRSETFKFVDGERDYASSYKLINCKGKLGGVRLLHVRYTIMMWVWVLEDVEKGEFSTYEYSLPGDEYSKSYVSVAGVTAAGEIVLFMHYVFTSTRSYVLYFNPEKKTQQSVEIQGFGDVFNITDIFNISSDNEVEVFIDHVDDLKFNIMKPSYAAASISQPEQKPKPTSTSTSHEAHLLQDRGTFEGNMVDALCLLDDD